MEYELVHLNLGLAKFPLNSEEMCSFWLLEKPILDVAKSFEGFSREIELSDRFSVFPEPHVFNVTAWKNIEDLKAFVYTGIHSDALKNRRRWFIESEYPKYVLFWSKVGLRHTEKSLSAKILAYAENGPTMEAFDFKTIFPMPLENFLLESQS